MPYRFATARENREDLAAGRVLYGRPGAAAFPVRLAAELFERGCALLEQAGNRGPYTLYDPFCGSGYLVTVLALLYPERLRCVLASDVDPEAVTATRRNLSLLTPEGLDRRAAEIRELLAAYGKDSHREALESLGRLKAAVEDHPEPVETHAFRLDAAGEDWPDETRAVDVVLTDLPYGRSSFWSGSVPAEHGLAAFLANAGSALRPGSVLAVVADHRLAAAHSGYCKAGSLKLGRRFVLFLRRNDG